MLFRSPTDQPPPPEEEASFQVALQQTPAERSAAKAAAVEACSAEQLALLQCYRQGSLLACSAAREAFWACYKRQRVRARARCGAGSRAPRAACTAVPNPCAMPPLQGFQRTVMDAALATKPQAQDDTNRGAAK
jgi:hypothetical protein